MGPERYRLVVEGPPNWTSFREFWRMFHEEGAVAVASTYTKVGGLYDRGFRHDPSRPLESLAEYWDCTERMLDFGGGRGPDQLVDDGGDATLLLTKGYEFTKAGKVPPPSSTDNEELQEVYRVLAETIQAQPDRWLKAAQTCKGVTEETTTGVKRLYEAAKRGLHEVVKRLAAVEREIEQEKVSA